MKFKIQNRYIGDDYPLFFIAEAGVNHNGSIELAKKRVGGSTFYPWDKNYLEKHGTFPSSLFLNEKKLELEKLISKSSSSSERENAKENFELKEERVELVKENLIADCNSMIDARSQNLQSEALRHDLIREFYIHNSISELKKKFTDNHYYLQLSDD